MITFAQPWRMGNVSDDYLDKMMRAVVGFEVEITRLEGKLRQNRSEVDQRRVAEVLGASSDELELGVAEMMESAQA